MANAKSTKRALISSVLALFLCITMLVGTTFAWFTDSVTSSSNIIKSGNLDVEMYWAEGAEDPDKAAWSDASQTAIFDYDRWEPGYVDVKHVKVSNVGTLALKYVLNIKANGEVSKLAEVIDVYYVQPAAQVDERTELDEAAKVGTLEDVLNGNVASVKGTLLATESDVLTVALKMQENAGNEYQNLSIGSDFSVQVLATQLAAEEDSFGNDYDAGAVTYVAYDSAKTALENGAALQTAINKATYGDIVLVGPGTYQYTGTLTVSTDNITIVGENGAVLENEAANSSGFLKVTGDDVVIRGFELNKNLTQANQVILAFGSENLTVDSCTIYGGNTGNTPTMGIYFFENLEVADDESNDEITKYTVVNNTFINVAVGSYKGGNAKVTTDPGAVAAQVSEEMLIENNTFVKSSVFIENWRSWRLENTRDHELVPTIRNNNFVSPYLCFDNTPHSIYLRCYREGNPDATLPAGYIEAFEANNTIAKPTNDTVVNYNGTDYVLSDNYDTFYRDNATYGIIAYCYGQTSAVPYNTVADLQAAIDNAEDGDVIVLGADFTGNVTVTQKPGVSITIDGDSKTFNGTITVDGKSAAYATAGLTIKNINFVADTVATEACINMGVSNNTNTRYIANLTVENCYFNVPGKVAIKSYDNGDKNLKIVGCTVAEGMHSLVQVNNVSGGLLVKDCSVYSKNGINVNQSEIVTIEGCEVDVLGYAVRFGATGGAVGIAETYVIKDCTLTSANNDGDATVILRATTDNATLTIENTTIVGTPDIENLSNAVVNR